MVAKINSWILSDIWILSSSILCLAGDTISGSRGSCVMSNPEKHQCALACSRSLYLPLAPWLLTEAAESLLQLYCRRASGEPTFVKRLRGKPTKLVSSLIDLVMIIEINKYSLSPKKTVFFSSFAFCDLERRVEKSQSWEHPLLLKGKDNNFKRPLIFIGSGFF